MNFVRRFIIVAVLLTLSVTPSAAYVYRTARGL